MNVIKLFADEKNSIKEIMALKHILRYFGLYVIENPQLDSKEYDVKSIADIYVVKKNDNKEQYVNNYNWSKTILISNESIDYNNDVSVIIDTTGCTSLQFLQEFTDQLLSIIESDIACINNLIIQSDDYRNIIKAIIKVYTENDIFENSIYIKYFYPNELLYQEISKNYTSYIKKLIEIYEEYYNSDLLTYNIIFAMYEMNLACKNEQSCTYLSR